MEVNGDSLHINQMLKIAHQTVVVQFSLVVICDLILLNQVEEMVLQMISLKYQREEKVLVLEIMVLEELIHQDVQMEQEHFLQVDIMGQAH